jgi:hypothetical protein
MRKLLFATTALMAMEASAFASNYIDLDSPGGSDNINSLAITQDAAHPTNTISANGSNPGTTFDVKGGWNSVAINQYGGNNVLSGGIAATTGSTTSAVSATYGASTGGGTEGFNTHSLTIGGTNAPVNPSVTILVANTNATPGSGNKNVITDVIDVSGGGTLTYGLTVTGDTNTLANTVSAAGNTTLTEGVTASSLNTLSNTLTSGGGTLNYTLAISGGNSNRVTNNVNATGAISMSQTLTGASNTVTDAIGGTTPVASYNETLAVTGGSNTIANTVAGGAAKTVNITLGSSGNNVTNNMSATGTQSSTLTADSLTKVAYTLTAGTVAAPLAGTSTADVILNNVIGSGGAQGLVNVTQNAPGTSVTLTLNGNGKTMGAGGINITQNSANTTTTLALTEHANGYVLYVTQ